MSYIYNISHWYGDHSDRVTSELVSISVIKSIHVLFGTIDGKSMGISESCRPLKSNIKKNLFFLIYKIINLTKKLIFLI